MMSVSTGKCTCGWWDCTIEAYGWRAQPITSFWVGLLMGSFMGIIPLALFLILPR